MKHDFSDKNLEDLKVMRETIMWIMMRCRVEKEKQNYEEAIRQIDDEVMIRKILE